MASGDVPNGERHGEHGQAKCQSHTKEADSKSGKARREHGGAASPEHEPEGSEKFRERTFTETHGFTPPGWIRRRGLSALILFCHPRRPCECYQMQLDLRRKISTRRQWPPRPSETRIRPAL